MTDDPYSAFREINSSNLVAVLRDLVDRQEEYQEVVDRLESELEVAKESLRTVVERDIPEALDGLEGNFDLQDGRKVEIGEKIRASIAGNRKIPAIEWLDAHGFGHIVRRTIVVEFKRDDQETHDAVLELLRSSGLKLNIKKDYSVHWMTLEAFVREKLSEGEQLPHDVFGIYRQRFSKIKR